MRFSDLLTKCPQLSAYFPHGLPSKGDCLERIWYCIDGIQESRNFRELREALVEIIPFFDNFPDASIESFGSHDVLVGFASSTEFWEIYGLALCAHFHDKVFGKRVCISDAVEFSVSSHFESRTFPIGLDASRLVAEVSCIDDSRMMLWRSYIAYCNSGGAIGSGYETTAAGRGENLQLSEFVDILCEMRIFVKDFLVEEYNSIFDVRNVGMPSVLVEGWLSTMHKFIELTLKDGALSFPLAHYGSTGSDADRINRLAVGHCLAYGYIAHLKRKETRESLACDLAFLESVESGSFPLGFEAARLYAESACYAEPYYMELWESYIHWRYESNRDQK
ncbi:hypothetical protein [Umezakia ovalisporum]|uniref:hypothetical protein n=1 Tax=Umezakia ovalisporum TaxID=75695 RepID=UPI0039C6CECC